HLGGGGRLNGRTVRIDGSILTVIGVMPKEFTYPSGTDVWLPFVPQGDSRTSHNWAATARLAPGATVADAQREISTLTRLMKARYGSDMDAVDAVVRPLREELTGSRREPLLLLLGSAALVLLIACANIASTLLARGADRQREIAVRTALGAGRGRVVRQLLMESVVLSALGTAAGLFAGWVVLRGLLAMGAGIVSPEQAGFDMRVLGFALTIGISTAMLFGLIPALRTSDSNLVQGLRQGARGSTTGARAIWRVLVLVEVALALVLLVGSGLLLQSFWAVLRNDPGFRPAGVLVADVSLPGQLEAPAVVGVYRNILDDVRRLPGVSAAGVTAYLPLGGSGINGGFLREGDPADQDSGTLWYRVAGAGYFEAMGIGLVKGRFFDSHDVKGTGDVAIVNEAAARQFWPEVSPIGRRIRRLRNDDFVYGDSTWLTIVGVVADVRHRSLTAPADAEVYVMAEQRPYRLSYGGSIAIRAGGDIGALAGQVRDIVARANADVPVEFRSLVDVVASSVADRRFTMIVLLLFAVVAVALAGVGIYGVVSFTVARRTREMGIRMALGATPASVRGLVVRGSMGAVLGGLVLGLLIAFAAKGVVKSLLYQVSATDMRIYFGGGALVLVAGYLASALPAFRATRIDPMTTMRSE
ncbi:MAG: ADOP family duplicated permease, partial [Gemmatimonadota bacterium]